MKTASGKKEQRPGLEAYMKALSRERLFLSGSVSAWDVI